VLGTTRPGTRAALARAVLTAGACLVGPAAVGPAAVGTVATGAAAVGALPVGRSYRYTAVPPVPAQGSCHARGVFPDPRCTPGAINPAVTQADIGSTICRPGWSESVRPPESYTEPLKYRLMASYGDTYPAYDYELDHLVSLELGGAATDPRNLWPEFGASPNPKDHVEDAAHEAVCDHRMSLATAQHEIATNWVVLGEQLGLGDLAGRVPKPRGSQVPGSSTAPGPSPGVSNKSPSGHYYKPGEWCPHRDLGKTIRDRYGTMTCEEPAGGGQPRWVEH
jgi:hypothetical protein